MRHRFSFIAAVLLIFASPAWAAKNLDRIDQLSQGEFRDLTGDLGAAVSYKAVIPVAALGVAGFDLGAEMTVTRIEHKGEWDRASSGSGPSTLYIPKVHIHKGLPAGFDVGAFYSSVTDTNINIWGAEIRYALVRGSTTVPAVGLRGTYSKITGVDQLDLDTKSVEIGVSKGFTVITPYAGIGRVWTEARPVGVSTLGPESHADTKIYGGASFNLLLGNLAVEADKTGNITSYSVKVGVRF